MEHFTPGLSLIGGLLIGAAASLLLLVNGSIAGVSGIVGGLFWGGAESEPRGWHALFLLGLVAGGWLACVAGWGAVDASPQSLPLVAAAGLLVGAGGALSNGCTSGHGICGLSRGSRRSLVATATFIAAGALTAVAVGLLQRNA